MRRFWATAGRRKLFGYTILHAKINHNFWAKGSTVRLMFFFQMEKHHRSAFSVIFTIVHTVKVPIVTMSPLQFPCANWILISWSIENLASTTCSMIITANWKAIPNNQRWHLFQQFIWLYNFFATDNRQKLSTSAIPWFKKNLLFY